MLFRGNGVKIVCNRDAETVIEVTYQYEIAYNLSQREDNYLMMTSTHIVHRRFTSNNAFHQTAFGCGAIELIDEEINR